MDVTVRAAAAIAEHHAHTGDRVALRVVGPRRRDGRVRRRARATCGMLLGPAGHPPGGAARPDAELTFGATAGTVVMVLSPMLSPEMGTATATLVKRGLPVMVVDTLPARCCPGRHRGHRPGRSPTLAWRMRRIERDQVLARLATLGCPVVAWRGPGTVDDVMRRLARRAQLPQVRVR